jgi:hypothetical protein
MRPERAKHRPCSGCILSEAHPGVRLSLKATVRGSSPWRRTPTSPAQSRSAPGLAGCLLRRGPRWGRAGPPGSSTTVPPRERPGGLGVHGVQAVASGGQLLRRSRFGLGCHPAGGSSPTSRSTAWRSRSACQVCRPYSSIRSQSSWCGDRRATRGGRAGRVRRLFGGVVGGRVEVPVGVGVPRVVAVGHSATVDLTGCEPGRRRKVVPVSDRCRTLRRLVAQPHGRIDVLLRAIPATGTLVIEPVLGTPTTPGAPHPPKRRPDPVQHGPPTSLSPAPH